MQLIKDVDEIQEEEERAKEAAEKKKKKKAIVEEEKEQKKLKKKQKEEGMQHYHFFHHFFQRQQTHDGQNEKKPLLSKDQSKISKPQSIMSIFSLSLFLWTRSIVLDKLCLRSLGCN